MSAGWVWVLGSVAGLVLVVGAWALLMARAIVRGINAMAVRDVKLGEPFLLSSAERVVRVSGLLLRHQAIESAADAGTVLTFTAVIDAPRPLCTTVSLRKPATAPGESAVFDGYLVELIEVSAAGGNKLSLYRARLRVTALPCVELWDPAVERGDPSAWNVCIAGNEVHAQQVAYQIEHRHRFALEPEAVSALVRLLAARIAVEQAAPQVAIEQHPEAEGGRRVVVVSEGVRRELLACTEAEQACWRSCRDTVLALIAPSLREAAPYYSRGPYVGALGPPFP